MSEPTISAGFARALLELAVSKGASRQLLLERLGSRIATYVHMQLRAIEESRINKKAKD